MAEPTTHSAGQPSQTSQLEIATTGPFTLHFTFTVWLTLKGSVKDSIQAHFLWAATACFYTNKYVIKYHVTSSQSCKERQKQRKCFVLVLFFQYFDRSDVSLSHWHIIIMPLTSHPIKLRKQSQWSPVCCRSSHSGDALFLNPETIED